MKVTRESPSELEFESRPTMFTLLFGLVCLLFFGVMMGVFWEPFTLECERGGMCQVRRYGLLSSPDEDFPTSELRGARVQSSRGSKGTTYRVALETARGTVPLTRAYSSEREDKDELAFEVKVFAEGRDARSLSLMRLSPLFFLFALAFLAVGLRMVARGSVRHVGLLQRGTGTLRLTRRGLVGRSTTEYPLSALGPLNAEPAGTENKQPLLKLTLRTRSGELLLEGTAFDTPETHDVISRVNDYLIPRRDSRERQTESA